MSTDTEIAIDRYIDTREAARMLGYEPDTLRIWRGKGWGPRWFRLRRNIRYKLSDIEEFLRQNSSSGQ